MVLRRMAIRLCNDEFSRCAVRGRVAKGCQGLPSATLFNTVTKNLVIMDDLMAETDERPCPSKKLSQVHVLYLVENLFPENKDSFTISLFSPYMVVFNKPRDASQLSHLAHQMYPGCVKIVQEDFKDVAVIYWSISNRKCHGSASAHDHLQLNDAQRINS